MDIHKFYDIALERMLEIADYQKAMCGKVEDIGKKAQADVDETAIHSALTYMDTFTQDCLMVALYSEFPHLVPLVEENTGMKRRFMDNKSDDVLIIDPIDGTSVYQKGGKDYSIMVGLLQQGQMSVGIACYPETKDVYAAIKEEGAWHIDAAGNKEKLMLVKGADLKSIVAHYRFFIKPFKEDSDKLKDKGYSIGTNIIDFGTNMSGALQIVNGESSAFIGPYMALTDLGVPSLIVEEAGGVLRSFDYDWESSILNQFTNLDPKGTNPRFRIILANQESTIERILQDMLIKQNNRQI